MPNCDWGRPCDCRECTEMSRTEICQICSKNKTFKTQSEYIIDRKGRHYYDFINYCSKCWEKKVEKDKKEEQRRIEEQNRKNAEIKNLEKILKTLKYDPIPIKNAINMYRDQIKISNSDRWIKDYIIRSFTDILLIEKVKNRWHCCKNRLNLIDFKLY